MPVAATVILIGLFLFALGGCSSAPKAVEQAPPAVQSSEPLGERAAQHAAQLVGRPYRYGGSSPATGFDCSGLVQWSYAQAGRKLPRSTDEQRASSSRVRRADLRPGDLIFFDQEGRKYGHVGLYVGGGEFVHAPSSGKRVKRDRLDAPYWSRHITETRRPNV